MQRYLLFSGEAYYPCGGMDDFQGSYPTLVECMQSDHVFAAAHACAAWWNVLDMRSGRVYHHHDIDFDQRLEWAAGIDSEA
jgi:hypothetical protein